MSSPGFQLKQNLIAPAKTHDGPVNETDQETQSLLSAQRRTLEMIAEGAGLNDILDELCRIIDAQQPDIVSSVLLTDADGKKLRPVAPGSTRMGGVNHPFVNRSAHGLVWHVCLSQAAGVQFGHRQRPALVQHSF